MHPNMLQLCPLTTDLGSGCAELNRAEQGCQKMDFPPTVQPTVVASCSGNPSIQTSYMAPRQWFPMHRNPSFNGNRFHHLTHCRYLETISVMCRRVGTLQMGMPVPAHAKRPQSGYPQPTWIWRILFRRQVSCIINCIATGCPSVRVL
jgi:hypothetical protein